MRVNGHGTPAANGRRAMDKAELAKKKPPSQVAFSRSARRTRRNAYSFASSEGDARR